MLLSYFRLTTEYFTPHKSFLHVWNVNIVSPCWTTQLFASYPIYSVLYQSSQRQKECVQFLVHFTHMLHTYVYSTLSPRGPGPLLRKRRLREKESKAEIVSLIRSQYWHRSLLQPDLKRVGPWRVDRQAVLGLGGGRAASWSGNRVVLWAYWLTDASVEHIRRLPGWPLSGPHRAPLCWCTSGSGSDRHKSRMESNWRVYAPQRSNTKRHLNNSDACVEWAGKDRDRRLT